MLVETTNIIFPIILTLYYIIRIFLRNPSYNEVVAQALDVIFLEGWCVNLAPDPAMLGQINNSEYL